MDLAMSEVKFPEAPFPIGLLYGSTLSSSNGAVLIATKFLTFLHLALQLSCPLRNVDYYSVGPPQL